MNDNCQLTIKEYLCHFDLLPFHGRRLNLMLLLSSRAEAYSAAPFFSRCQNDHFILQLRPTPVLIRQYEILQPIRADFSL